jgi:hypothetical protein
MDETDMDNIQHNDHHHTASYCDEINQSHFQSRTMITQLSQQIHAAVITLMSSYRQKKSLQRWSLRCKILRLYNNIQNYSFKSLVLQKRYFDYGFYYRKNQVTQRKKRRLILLRKPFSRFLSFFQHQKTLNYLIVIVINFMNNNKLKLILKIWRNRIISLRNRKEKMKQSKKFYLRKKMKLTLQILKIQSQSSVKLDLSSSSAVQESKSPSMKNIRRIFTMR